MEEEKKDKKGLKIALIIFLVLCLIATGYFVYKIIYVEKNKEESSLIDKVEIPNLQAILTMIPVKLTNGAYSSYKVSDLTNKDINNAIVKYIINNTELTTKDNESYYLEKLSNVEDNLFNLLGLTDYVIKYDAGLDYIGYTNEKVMENDVDYLKIKLTEYAGRDGDYELQDLNDISYNKDKGEYLVKALVIENVSEGPQLKIGKATFTLKSANGKTTLQELAFEKYDENDPIE